MILAAITAIGIPLITAFIAWYDDRSSGSLSH
jgi:hypothetical protein